MPSEVIKNTVDGGINGPFPCYCTDNYTVLLQSTVSTCTFAQTHTRSCHKLQPTLNCNCLPNLQGLQCITMFTRESQASRGGLVSFSSVK